MKSQQQVAKVPTTLQEAMNVNPDELVSYSLAQLESVHTLYSQGTTKAAGRMKFLVEERMKSQKKEAAKASKKPQAAAEPVANSTKPTSRPKPAGTSPKPAEKPKADPKPKEDAKPAEKPKTDAKPKADPKPKQEPVKPAAKPAKPPAKPKPPVVVQEEPEDEDGFPQMIDGDAYTYKLLEINDVEQLAHALVEHPYSIYLFMDENDEDGMLTQFLIVYASDPSVLVVDCSRKINTFMHFEGYMIEDGHYTMTFERKKHKFPFAIYVREAK